MSRSVRNRARPTLLDTLESRQLLSAAKLPGNVGQVLQSQFDAFGFKTAVGAELQGVKLSGPLSLDLVSDSPPGGVDPVASTTPVNSGLIRRSQFNGGGFQTVGLQFKNVQIRGGLSVGGSSNDDSLVTRNDPRDPASNGRLPLPSTVKNRNVVSNTQFNDGGFGGIEVQPDGAIVGHEGRVGLQFRNVRVRGSVSVGVDVDTVRPGGSVASAAASTSEISAAAAGQTVIDLSTNSGRIRNSQFNDGGFGDIGFQWAQVGVGGRVATSSNSLFINPTADDGAPITVANRTFGKGRTATAAQPVAARSSVNSATVRADALTAARSSAPTGTDTNSATNSGRILSSQFNDGGFGDIGLQWKNVRVRQGVTAVHNSLTVQPDNNGQGLITVQGINFPATPATTARPAKAKSRFLPASPKVVAADGDPVGKTLPAPTGPISPLFPTPLAGAGTVTLPFAGNYPLVNAASNSGLILGGQFNAGGFGDQGLQWKNVQVGGHVSVVHNSLSVHPEGSGLAGISVSDVSYGPAVSSGIAKHLAVLKSAVITPADSSDARGPKPSIASKAPILYPPNSRVLTNQQVAAAGSTDVFLQWNAIEHHRGLILVHNVIQIMGVGVNTGPITLSNIRFPFKVPSLAPLQVTTSSAAAVSASATNQDPVLLNSANNSGVIKNAQFSDGGFGDDGLQWNHVRVDGSVDVVHNTLSVDETADLPTGDVPGPISISNVTFNSGALENIGSKRTDQVLVSPPDLFQRASSRKLNFGHALPANPAAAGDATNSGILSGSQLASGGANHALLQWQAVRAKGKVRVIDNVLAISVLDRPSGPISISNVTFA